MSCGDLGTSVAAPPSRRDGVDRVGLNLPSGPGTCRDRLGEAETDRHGRSLHPTGHAELGEDVADVDAHGLLADEQALADLAVRPAFGDQGQDLALAPGQA